MFPTEFGWYHDIAVGILFCFCYLFGVLHGWIMRLWFVRKKFKREQLVRYNSDMWRK